jgi:hypothetical protein
MKERAGLNGFRIRKEGSVEERIGRELEKDERTGKFRTDQ